MGTSKGYPAPTTPEWSRHKTQVTNASRNGSVLQETARVILRDYIRANGGAIATSQGGGTIGGDSGRQIGRNIARFINSLANQGLENTLREEGLNHLIGRPAKDVVLTLMDQLSGNANTLDQVDARNALSDILNEILDIAESFEEIESIFSKIIEENTLEQLLTRFFGYYLYRQFCRVYYERLVTRHGEKIAKEFLTSIKQTIIALINLKTYDRNLYESNWNGQDGIQLSTEILEETYRIFDR